MNPRSPLCIIGVTALCYLVYQAACPAADKPAPKAPPAADSGKPAAAAPPVVLPDPVATVNGENISRKELEDALQSVLQSSGAAAVELPASEKARAYRSILDEMIVERLVRKASAGQKVDDAAVEKQFAQIKSQFPSEKELQAQMAKDGKSIDELKNMLRTSMQQQAWVESQSATAKVTDEDITKFYGEHPEFFKTGDQVRASHILLMVPKDAKPEEVAAKEKQINEIAARIKKGEKFDVLAKEFSEDPGSKTDGGDLNFFTKDRMVPAFSEAAFKLKKDEVSPPVRSEFGFHLIKVTDQKPAGVTPFADVKDQIGQVMGNQRRQEAMSKVLAGLREKADVKINLPPLPAPEAAPGAPAPKQP